MSNTHADDLSAALRELAASASPHNNDADVPPGHRPCPICGQAMETIQQFHVTIDVCEAHGVWLDQGEFATILNRAYWHRREIDAKPKIDQLHHMDETRMNFNAAVRRFGTVLGRDLGI